MLKMVYRTFCLMFALTISKTASQNLTITSDCITAGTRVTLKCDTTNFATAVLFYLNGVNKGGCTTFSCATTITGYEQPSQSGTSTEMAITAYDHSRDGGDWTCTYGASTSSPYTVEFGNCDSTCVGCWIAILLFILLGLFPPTVKIVIILYLWYKYRYCKRAATPVIPTGIPEDTNIRIIITAQKQIILATKRINNGERQNISLCNSCHKIIIRVRAGVTIQCSFQVDGTMFVLSFLITEDMLNARPGKIIKLPTKLEVYPEYETIQWSFKREELYCENKYYETTASLDTYGVYDIEMKFPKQVMIFIQNMRVQDEPDRRCCYWKLMILFVVIDIVLAVICGIVIGLNRLKDGFCVEEIVIICVVLIPLIVTVVEMVLIYFMLIKRTESKESSGSQDSDMVKITSSETRTGSPNAETTTFITRTGSPNAETTTFTTDVLSSSDVTATT